MNEYKLTVKIPEGLHARPCAKLVELLAPYAPVVFSYGDKTIDCLSVLELLMARLENGSSLTIETASKLPSAAERELKRIFSGR